MTFSRWFIDRGVHVEPVLGGWATVWRTRAGGLVHDLFAYGPRVALYNLVGTLRNWEMPRVQNRS